MKTKKIVLLLMIFVVSIGSINAQWKSVNIVPSYSHMNIYCFASAGSFIYAGTSKGIYLSSDNGENWLRVSSTFYDINSLLIKGSKIFVGTNYGAFLGTVNDTSWTPINNGFTFGHLTEIHAFAIKDNYIFTSTSSGVYVSANDGTSWTSANNGIENVVGLDAIYSFLVQGNIIYAGSIYDNWVDS